MQLNISIPEPCRESWAQMTPTAQGAFCRACNKEVIDFSNYSTNQLIAYFSNYTGGGMCGRFKNTQLGTYTITVNPRVLQWKIPLWKKMLAVLLICFGNMLFNGTAVFSQVQPLHIKAASATQYKKKAAGKGKYKKQRFKKRHRPDRIWSTMVSGNFQVALPAPPSITPQEVRAETPARLVLKPQHYPVLTSETGASQKLPAKEDSPTPEKQTAFVAAAAVMPFNPRRRRRKLRGGL